MTRTDISRIPNNTRASRNGENLEDFVRRLLPGIKFLDGQIDAEYQGKLLEVKSCQEGVTDNSHPNTRKRSGRFLFESEQHSALLEAGGEYLFIVHTEGDPRITFRAAAEQIGLPAFSGSKAVAWRTVAKKFVGVA